MPQIAMLKLSCITQWIRFKNLQWDVYMENKGFFITKVQNRFYIKLPVLKNEIILT